MSRAFRDAPDIPREEFLEKGRGILSRDFDAAKESDVEEAGSRPNGMIFILDVGEHLRHVPALELRHPGFRLKMLMVKNRLFHAVLRLMLMERRLLS